MGSNTSRTIYASLAAVFFFAAVVFFSQNANLQKQNRSMADELSRLKALTDQIKTENRKVTETVSDTSAQLKKTTDAIGKENSALKTELEKLRADMQSAADEKSYLEEILINKTKEIEALQKRAGAAPAAVEALPLTSKDEEIKKLSERNAILSRKIQRLYKLTSQRMSEINVAKIALEETISSARRQIENEWNTVDLGSISVETPGAPKAKPDAGAAPPAAAAKRQGRVLAVNAEHGFVVVDMGRSDGISSDTVFSLLKNGQDEGTLGVLEIRDVMTACNIRDIQKGVRIEVNDPVSIRK